MTVEIQHILEEVAREDSGALPNMDRVEADARGRRRRRRAVRGMGAALIVVAMVIGAIQLTRPESTDLRVADAPTDVVEVVVATLEGEAISLTLSDAIGSDFRVVEQHAAINLGGKAWHATAYRNGGTGISDSCGEPGQTAVARIVDGWTMAMAGDGMDQAACELLVAELARFEVVDGMARYTGEAALGPSDGPDVAAETSAAHLSVFMRPCDARQASTASGLAHTQIDDPAREATLTVLCDTAAELELWIHAETWPTEADLDAVAINFGE